MLDQFPEIRIELTVNHSLGDSLSVKVGEQVDQVKVLQEQRTVGPDSLDLCCMSATGNESHGKERTIGVRHWHTIRGGVQALFRRSVPVFLVVLQVRVVLAVAVAVLTGDGASGAVGGDVGCVSRHDGYMRCMSAQGL